MKRFISTLSLALCCASLLLSSLHWHENTVSGEVHTGCGRPDTQPHQEHRPSEGPVEQDEADCTLCALAKLPLLTVATATPFVIHRIGTVNDVIPLQRPFAERLQVSGSPRAPPA